jgi:alkanesulfonate monooxygenase SsuD/methylene tetrahydromethanopterin reductase-like flavin-dependent oxidoreductase (luciferase family)
VILDIFAELQRPGPRSRGFERQLYADAIEQAVLADALGFGCWWAVEHHGSPEFSYSSAPDLLLAVISQHTGRLRLGHSGVLGAFAINHPLRVAERAAFLDNLSGGRLELGLARSVPHEWETFGCDGESARQQIREALRIIPQMWAEGPFSSDNEHLKMPAREVVPKPLQAPHPPLWVTAAHPDGFEQAGRMGVGVLATVMLSPLRHLAILFDAYRRGLSACEPVGAFANDQRAVMAFVHCAETREQAIASRAAEAALWFMNAQPDVFGVNRELWLQTLREKLPLWTNADAHLPEGATQIAGDLDDPEPVIALMNRLHAGLEIDPVEAYEALLPLDSVIIGDVETCRRKLAAYAELGVDRLMCLMQMGHLPHEQVLRSIRVAGKFLVPELAG